MVKRCALVMLLPPLTVLLSSRTSMRATRRSGTCTGGWGGRGDERRAKREPKETR